MRVAADVPEGDDDEDEGPQRVTVDPPVLAALFEAEAGLPPNLAAALSAIGPLDGATYESGDRLVATFTVEGD